MRLGPADLASRRHAGNLSWDFQRSPTQKRWPRKQNEMCLIRQYPKTLEAALLTGRDEEIQNECCQCIQ
jgi:hypothetical protein